MEAILECCCGLDVHRDIITACLLKGPLDQKPEATIREFSALPQGLQELRSWLQAENCRHVAMESTGVYWKPVYNVLEEDKLVILLVNARHIKNVPGRKTDIKDAQWIAQLLRTGLLRGRFIPPKPIRELRELTRYRKSLVEEAASQKNRIEKLLQTNAIKLSSVLSDVFGASGRTILEHLIAHGQADPLSFEGLFKGQSAPKRRANCRGHPGYFIRTATQAFKNAA